MLQYPQRNVGWGCNMAQEILYFGIQYKLYDKNFTAEVIGTIMTNCSLVIPNVVDSNGHQYKVNCIGRNAFKDVNLNSVNIPNTIEIISNKAFYGSKIEHVCFIPHSHIIDIFESAFANCRYLQSVQFNGPVFLSAPKTFMNCEMLETMDTENIVDEIDYGTFHRCNKLKEFKFSDGIIVENLAFVSSCFDKITLVGTVKGVDHLLSAIHNNTVISCTSNAPAEILELAFDGQQILIT